MTIDVNQSAVIWHITTMGGRVRALPRRDSDGPGINAMSDHLDRGLAYGRDPISTLPGHATLMSAEGHELLATVFLDKQDGPLPLVTFGIATQASANAERLWNIVGGIGSPPPIPWCAAREEPYAAGHHITLPHLAAYGQSLAWAWLDRIRAKSSTP